MDAYYQDDPAPTRYPTLLQFLGEHSMHAQDLEPVSKLPRDEAHLQAHAARLAYDEQLASISAAAMVHRTTATGAATACDPVVWDAWVRSVDGLVEIERRAVDAHRVAFGGPQRTEMLRAACREVAFPLVADLDPNQWHNWALDTFRRFADEVEPEDLARAEHLLDDAVRFASCNRFLSAAVMLREFMALAELTRAEP